MTDDEKEKLWNEFIAVRGVNDPCPKCRGLGTRIYGNTATWRGGIGGQMMTYDVCDSCWGSGDKNRPWFNLRNLPLRAARTDPKPETP